MNLDERLEALTWNLELMYQIHQDHVNEYKEVVATISNAIISTDRQMKKLLAIAEIHEKRIAKLEERK